jgi:hypothetical protein
MPEIKGARMRKTVKEILEAYVRDNDYAGLQSDFAHCSCEPGEKFMACISAFHGCRPVLKDEFQYQGFRPVPTPCDFCKKESCIGCPEMEKEMK